MSRTVQPGADGGARRWLAPLLVVGVVLAVVVASALAPASSDDAPAGAMRAPADDGVAGRAASGGGATTSDPPLGRHLPSERRTASPPVGIGGGDTSASTPPTAPPQDPDAPAVVARPIPSATPAEPPPPAPPPTWAPSTTMTAAGYVSTDVGCLPGGEPVPSAAALDAFLASRVGPVIGWDYQHVYPLGGDRSLWLFQDAFVDHSGGATTLAQSGFAHNVAMLQDGRCFRVLHRGSTSRPAPFEPGTGSSTLSTWFWPMGGEVHDGQLHVFWVRMVKDGYDPGPPDGLGWHPEETWVATYDPETLARLAFRPAPNSAVTPIYGYAVASDDTHTYLFGNTFEQNLAREGGYWAGRHSATEIRLARVPRGQLFAAPEYRTASGWSTDPAAAIAVLDRHWAEFPFQPRFIDGQWVGVAAIDGYWGDAFSVDVALQPWGPWTTVESRPLAPRGGDPKMNTYHAHLAPWRDAAGNLVVTVSNNARDMRTDAWPHPHRYRPTAFAAAFVPAPPPPPTSAAPQTSPAPTSPSPADASQPGPTTAGSVATSPPRSATTQPASTTTSTPATVGTTTGSTSTTTSSEPVPASSASPGASPSEPGSSLPGLGQPAPTSLPQR